MIRVYKHIKKLINKLARLLINTDRLRRHSRLYKFRNAGIWFWMYPPILRYSLYKASNWFINDKNTKYKIPESLHRYITFISAHESEGIGGQLTKWNTSLILAKKYNLQFVHHQFTKSIHSPDSDWEGFFSIGEEFIQHREVMNNDKLRIISLPPMQINMDDITVFKRKLDMSFLDIIFNRIYVTDNILFILGSPTCSYDQLFTRDILREKYWQARINKPVEHVHDCHKINVAVHIRRSDVSKMKDKQNPGWKERWLDETYYLNICKQINQIFDEKNTVIHVYSDGDITELDNLKEQLENITFHLDNGNETKPFHAFHSMVVADILVMGNSSFSYFAAILSDGIKIANYPWVHYIPQNSGWVRSDKNGKFDPKVIQEKYKDHHLKVAG